MKFSKQMLIIAGFLSFSVAIFQTVISFSPTWSEYFGAPKELVTNIPLLIVAGVAAGLVFFFFGLFALSGAGSIRPLPFLKLGLLGIGCIYTIRGSVLFPLLFKIMGNQQLSSSDPPAAIQSSLVSLFIGLIYLTGTISGWKSLPSRKNRLGSN